MEKKFYLELVGITYNQIESGVYALVLQQVGGPRRIPIIIGFPEAQAIECKLQEVATPRPLTHDTMVATLASFGISLIEVEIRKLPNGVFAANLHLSNGKTTRIVDSRSSDAIALAIRVGAPIYTSEAVLYESGFLPGDSREDDEILASNIKSPDEEDSFSGVSTDLLYEKMNKAAENENYEEAARIKSEIDKRNDNHQIS